MSIYERELREILSANESILQKITRSCSPEEKRKYMKVKKKPFIVIRAAGSFGIADIVAIRDDISFIIEIKVRKEKEILFSHEGGRMQKKAEEMKEKCSRSGILPLFAYRMKGIRGDAWRIFTIELNGLSGKSMELNRIIPKIDKTENGNYIMKWDKGMKLSDFIEIITDSI